MYCTINIIILMLLSLHWAFTVGMTKECFDLIFEHVEEKSQRINMWKGAKKTKTGKIDKKY